MGTNMAYIQEALGRQDMEATRLYVRVCMEQMKEIVERVSAQAYASALLGKRKAAYE